MNDWYEGDLAPEEFRRLGYRAIDMIADYYASVRDLRVLPEAGPREVAAAFDDPLPLEPTDPDRILDQWTERVLPHTTHLGSPRYFGFVNGSGSMMGTLADALAASVNMNPGGWKPAPAATEIEKVTLRWIAEAIGYGNPSGGLLTSGGMMANFTALTAALRNLADHDVTRDGIQHPDGGRYRVYMSDHEGHVSIPAATDLMGLGRDAVVRVASRDDLSLDVDALRAAIAATRAAGDHPLAVVAQVGSINVGIIDPLPEIADVCAEHGLWFHADGACGAVGGMLPEKRSLYAGLERADSVTLDPHKWLYVPYECGALLVRDPERLRRSFSMSAPYLRGSIPSADEGLDYYDHGPQMSRGFRALKLWMTLQQYGLDGYRRLLRQNVRCAEHLHTLVTDAEDFEVLHEPVLYIYSFRFAPPHLRENDSDPETSARLDRLNQEICDELQRSGEAFVMSSRHRGRVVIRLSICSHRTTPADIDRVFAAIVEISRGRTG